MSLAEQFDFRMDKSSWAMILFMIATVMYFMVVGAQDIVFMDYLKAFGFSVLVVFVLLTLMSIPVVIYCYFVKMIPDIDYSVRVAFVFTLIGIITEFIF